MWFNKLNSGNSFSDIESRLNRLLDSKEIPWIDTIIEVTYSYDSFNYDWKRYHYNSSLFSDFCNYENPIDKKNSILKEGMTLESIDFEEIKDIFFKKTSDIKIALLKIKIELEEWDFDDLDENKKLIVLEAIDYNIKLIDLAQNWFDFELAKAWYNNGLSEEEIENKIKENERLETLAFWWKISKNKYEAELTYKYIVEQVNSWLNDKKISYEEHERLVWYLEKIWNILVANGFNLISPHYQIDFEDNSSESLTWSFLSKYWSVEIPRESYYQLFKSNFEMHWIEKEVKSSSVSWVYDWPNSLEFSEKKIFDTLTIERILKLKSHEIAEHYVSQQNHEVSWWLKIRWAWNVEKSEWLAKLMDGLVIWKKIEWTWIIIPNFARILAWEILSKGEQKDFIDLFWKCTEKKTSDESVFLRQNRNYPFEYTWVQHKDVTYIRWLIKVLIYLEELWDIKDLFKWKFSLEDIKNWKADFVQDLLYPIFVSDMIIFYFICEENHDLKFNHKNFIDFLRDKYSNALPNFDWSEVEKVNISELKIFSSMIKIVRESVKMNVSSNI